MLKVKKVLLDQLLRWCLHFQRNLIRVRQHLTLFFRAWLDVVVVVVAPAVVAVRFSESIREEPYGQTRDRWRQLCERCCCCWLSFLKKYFNVIFKIHLQLKTPYTNLKWDNTWLVKLKRYNWQFRKQKSCWSCCVKNVLKKNVLAHDLSALVIMHPNILMKQFLIRFLLKVKKICFIHKW